MWNKINFFALIASFFRMGSCFGLQAHFVALWDANMSTQKDVQYEPFVRSFAFDHFCFSYSFCSGKHRCDCVLLLFFPTRFAQCGGAENGSVVLDCVAAGVRGRLYLCTLGVGVVQKTRSVVDMRVP